MCTQWTSKSVLYFVHGSWKIDLQRHFFVNKALIFWEFQNKRIFSLYGFDGDRILCVENSCASMPRGFLVVGFKKYTIQQPKNLSAQRHMNFRDRRDRTHFHELIEMKEDLEKVTTEPNHFGSQTLLTLSSHQYPPPISQLSQPFSNTPYSLGFPPPPLCRRSDHALDLAM